MKGRVMGELKKVFRPEFLNRIDEVIVFHKLTKEEITEIVDLLLLRIRASLTERDLQLELTEAANDFLVEKGWDPSMGARPLRRAIQRYIEDPLADFVLQSQLPEEGGTVMVDKAPEDDDRDLILTIAKAPARKKVTVPPEPEAEESGEAADEPPPADEAKE
jgi:ATP-dependent Clp protease ATP-binding subunit ClpC